MEQTLSWVPHDIPCLLVGDFNARTGSRQSMCSLGLTAHRASSDSTVCSRGGWFLDLCTTLDLVLFNGM